MAESTHHTREHTEEQEEPAPVPPPADMSLADVFAKVTVSPTQGAAILQGLIKDIYDRDPTLHATVMQAVTELTTSG